MLSYIYNNFFYLPLYNAMVFLTSIIPGHDLGVAVVVLTLFVKIILIPITHKTIRTQKKLKELEPEISKIKEKHKDQQEQALKIMDLYREHDVNPFSGVFLMFIQLPIILGLFFVFRAGIDLSSPNIYSFVPKPPFLSQMFLGLVDLSKSNIYLSILVGVTQFFQVQLSVPPTPPISKDKEVSFGEGLTQSMNFQMKFILPVFIMFISYKLNTAVSIYWIVNNLFTIGHEMFVKRQAKDIIW